MHTKGPWHYAGFNGVGGCHNVSDAEPRSVCAPHGPPQSQTAIDNGRLIAAACTSYDKHFGDRAVEAAEGDVLGRALEALRELEAAIAKDEDSGESIRRIVHARHEARAVLSLVEGEK